MLANQEKHESIFMKNYNTTYITKYHKILLMGDLKARAKW